jgi:hypothetical protein
MEFSIPFSLSAVSYGGCFLFFVVIYLSKPNRYLTFLEKVTQAKFVRKIYAEFTEAVRQGTFTVCVYSSICMYFVCEQVSCVCMT